MELKEEFMNEEKFANIICSIVKDNNLNYFDAVLHFCKENELEPEDVAKFVDTNLKERIRLGAIENQLLASESTSLDI